MQCSLMSSRLFADGKERKWLCNHLNLNFDENMSIDQILFCFLGKHLAAKFKKPGGQELDLGSLTRRQNKKT